MKKIRTIIIGILIGLIISFVLIFIQIKNAKGGLEETFSNYHASLSNGFLEHGYNIYISEGDANESELSKRDGVVFLNNGPLTDSSKQMQCYLTKNLAGVNTSEVKLSSGKTAMTDIHNFYSQIEKSILMENTLLLVRKDPETNAELFYTYEDASLTDQINEIIEKNGEDSGEFVFDVHGVYIKGDEFVPVEISCCRVGEGGTVSDQRIIHHLDEDMNPEMDGYSYENIEDTFLLEDMNESDTYIRYCGKIDEKTSDRMDTLLSRTIDNEKLDTVIKKGKGLFAEEYFEVSEFTAPDTGEKYYAASYKYYNILYDLAWNGGSDGRGLTYLELFLIEIFGISLLSVGIALVLGRLFSNK